MKVMQDNLKSREKIFYGNMVQFKNNIQKQNKFSDLIKVSLF